jgi:hypothetical protein
MPISLTTIFLYSEDDILRYDAVYCDSIVTRLRDGQQKNCGSIPDRGARFFSSPQRPNRLCGPSSLLCNEYLGLSPPGQSGRGMKPTTNFHPAPSSRMHGAIRSVLHYVFMERCLISTWTNLSFAFLHL